ncbi:5'-methylthioadenosine/S-adenosylhomocysteine nucleosidase [Cellulomonas sp.]|uniref:5'-methylthioadenosine/S-adenosylhomocysteine nucleosidase n=1 Tax=Cellulomonas sp. TaxID=40001 RepID=UPI00258B9E4B|nr:5'-methylthioadenosine/S-adenosylhomocysteine nucleosidase [Cellulomonas sp.]MCR6689488.1 5'-methylthioadenosine/S-adenosylhomocysteine nucleosidase [Cellulomonas sp.]
MTDARTPAVDGTGRVDAVVVVAMDVEAEPFVALAESADAARDVAGATWRRLRLVGRDVLLVRSGVGLVNAAASAALALAVHPPTILLSAGSAGGLGVGVRVGDVVVGTEHVYTGADARAFGYVLGQVPGMPATYAGDPTLHADALAAAAALGPWADAPHDVRVLPGAIVAGDVFVDADRVGPVREAFPAALATDMETTALAQTAFRAGVPFLSVRGISDLCSPMEAGEFATHVDDAADRSAAVVAALLASTRLLA